MPLGGPIQGDPEKAWLNERLLWAREADGLLVADPFSFTIDIFDEKLAWNRRVRRVAEWIPADLPTEMADGVFDKPMNAALRSVWEDNEGVLWVTMTVPSPDWRPERPRPLSDPQEIAALVKRPRLDTIVEAIDLDRGHVLARLRLPGPQGVFFGSGYLAKSVEDESLIEPQIQISRVRLDR